MCSIQSLAVSVLQRKIRQAEEESPEVTGKGSVLEGAVGAASLRT